MSLERVSIFLLAVAARQQKTVECHTESTSNESIQLSDFFLSFFHYTYFFYY